MSSVSIATGNSKRHELPIEKPSSQNNSYSTGYLMLFLWLLAAVISAANTEISGNVTGVSVTFNVQDILTTLTATGFLTRGLYYSNPYFIFPWIMVSSWNVYQFQYPNLVKILYNVQRARSVSRLAWIAFGIDTLGVAIKTLLIIRIAHLSVNMWYQNKVKSETYNN